LCEFHSLCKKMSIFFNPYTGFCIIIYKSQFFPLTLASVREGPLQYSKMIVSSCGYTNVLIPITSIFYRPLQKINMSIRSCSLTYACIPTTVIYPGPAQYIQLSTFCSRLADINVPFVVFFLSPLQNYNMTKESCC